jgi:hypothetical protein
MQHRLHLMVDGVMPGVACYIASSVIVNIGEGVHMSRCFFSAA